MFLLFELLSLLKVSLTIILGRCELAILTESFWFQDREIMRVLIECCLQEKVFNKYYVALASKLCEHDKNHKFTLQVPLLFHLLKMNY